MFSFLTAVALTQPSLPPTHFPLDVLKTSTVAQQASAQPLNPYLIAAANGYPIAQQVLIGANQVLQPQDIRQLPGQLDTIPVVNSNSPEAVRQPGILLSTFPSQGKLYPEAHLNLPLQGRFDLFAHHIAKTDKPDTTPTLYNGILIYNPSPTRTVTVDVLKAGSFLGNPDAPYINLPSFLDNSLGRIFSGPGSRLTDTLLRNNRQANWPSRIYLRPKQSDMLMNLPIPVPRPALAKLPWVPVTRVMIPTLTQQHPALNLIPLNTASSSNTRSTLLQLYSNGPVYIACLALSASVAPNGLEGIPRKSDWENLIVNGKLAEPRDIPPSPLETMNSRFYYGRVAGVSRGSQWQAQITDTPRSRHLTIPSTGEAFSYGLSTLPRGTFGTGQIQSAPMLARYPDTAYMAHGNYGVHYQVAMPLYNPNPLPQKVAISIQTPLKQNTWDKGLRFLRFLPDQVFFRGTVRVRYRDDNGNSQLRYYHLSQRQGEQGQPLAMLTLDPKENRLIDLDYFYPPDATPPQVLTVQTLADTSFRQQSAYGIQR